MSIGVLIPFSGINSAKSRLRKDLDDEVVEKLLFQMVQHIILEVNKLKEKKKTYILTKNDKIHFKGNYEIIKDKGKNLNDALVKAFSFIKEKIILILMADLPLIQTEDIERIILAIKKGYQIVLAPTFDNGTSVLSFHKKTSFPLVFGNKSSLKFQQIFQEKNIKYELLKPDDCYRDIDTFKDLIEIEENNLLPDWLSKINYKASGLNE